MSYATSSRWTSRTLKTLAVAATAVLALSACTAAVTARPSDDGASGAPVVNDAMVADYGLQGLDAHEIIDRLDAVKVAERPEGLMVSIRPNELRLTDQTKRETTFPMPDDQFYVSIAPYEGDTHDCYFHSLTTCIGEMQNASVHVLATDANSGEILIDEVRTTFDNGFVGLWLPRDIDVTVSIDSGGRSATTGLSTRNDDDATCVTTMKLA